MDFNILLTVFSCVTVDAVMSSPANCHSCDGPYEGNRKQLSNENDDLKCEVGFYLQKTPGPDCHCQKTCLPCDICGFGQNMFLNYEAQPCGEFQNTICCHGRNMAVVNGHCVEATTWSAPVKTSNFPAVMSKLYLEEVTIPNAQERNASECIKINFVFAVSITALYHWFMPQ